MYAGFSLSLKKQDFIHLNNTDETSVFFSQHDQQKQSVRDDLNSFLLSDGSLSASEIQKIWFPSIKTDIFISHSHRDEEIAKKLACWLLNNFNITSFIDSTVWGYCADLQRSIDNKYCRSEDWGFYDYDKRNISTAHTHMILSAALNSMIDSSECLIFLNTDNSICPSDCIKNASTYSPWIFGELLFSSVVRRRPRNDHRTRRRVAEESWDHVEAKHDLVVQYPAHIGHLKKICINTLQKLGRQSLQKSNDYLDFLYRETGITDGKYE